MFKAILLEQGEGGATQATLKDIDDAALPEGEVQVAVRWSSLNYKDALAITGKSPIVRKWPMIPGIDFAGIVERLFQIAVAQGGLAIAKGGNAVARHQISACDGSNRMG